LLDFIFLLNRKNR